MLEIDSVTTQRIREVLLMCGMTTTHDYRGYVFLITYAPEDPAYVVEFSDIPDIVTSGQTLPEAFHHACEALDLHLESLQKLSHPFPSRKHRVLVESAS